MSAGGALYVDHRVYFNVHINLTRCYFFENFANTYTTGTTYGGAAHFTVSTMFRPAFPVSSGIPSDISEVNIIDSNFDGNFAIFSELDISVSSSDAIGGAVSFQGLMEAPTALAINLQGTIFQ
jgi:hypothetical protein